MIITAIERAPKRRGRVAVYIDGALACELAREAARGAGLHPGDAVAQPQIDALVAADSRRVAMTTAIAMLARRPHSEREVQRRLLQRKIAAGVIDDTIARLRTAKLLDDAEFARAWTQARDERSPRGRRLIVQELRTAGVELTVATDAAAGVEEPDAAYRVASKRARSLAALDRNAFRNRLGAFLQRRGFGWDVAGATVDRCWQELDHPATAHDDWADA